MPPQISNAAVKVLRGAARDGRTRYDDFAILLHWLTALLVVAQFAISQTWGFAPRPTRHLMIVAHMSFGILLAAIVVTRIVWRLSPGHRVRRAWTGPAEGLAKGMHWLLYGLLAAEGVLGFLLRWSGDEAMSFFGLLIPPPFEPWSKPAHEIVGGIHEWVGWAIIILACGHALAAIFHQVVLKDDVMWRMLPGERARRMTERTPSPEQAAGV